MWWHRLVDVDADNRAEFGFAGWCANVVHGRGSVLMALAGGIGKADSRSVEAFEVLLLRGVPGPVDTLSSQWSPEASIVV